MRSRLLALALALAACALAPAQFSFVYSAQPNVPIPSSGTGGAAGLCATAANKTVVTVNAADAYRMTHVYVGFTLNHSYAHDLRITVIHGGASVVVFDQHPASSGLAFSGYYSFNGNASSTIAAGCNPNLPAIVNGSYQPQQPLTAFNGLNTAGPWTIEICDLSGLDTGTLIDFYIVAEVAHLFQMPFQNSETIPDGAAAGCVAPLTHVFNVPPGGGPIANLSISFNLYHPRAADLELTLTHGPVSVTLCSPNTPPSTNALSGLYSFDDWAYQTWDEALAQWNFYVPSWDYRPDSPLSAFEGVDSAGPWFVTVCDAVPGNTGSLFGLELLFSSAAYWFDVSQPAGSGSIVLANSGGTAGNHYLNAFTVVPGSFPAGWLNGLDISMTELAYQVSFGPPFFGTLDANGNATLTIPGPIPTNLYVQFASFELAPDTTLVNSIPARGFMTAP